MVQTYREALRCEALRADVFAGRRSPMLFGDPEPWLALMAEALRLAPVASTATRKRCAHRRWKPRPPPVAPSMALLSNGSPMPIRAWGRWLETIINGRYYWVPFSPYP
ncbi:MAG: hypothetical protein U1F68_01840 [Gammaproteobacteria bacterium]